jgi:hypothetical protein
MDTGMNHGQSVFAQFISCLPFDHFEHLVDKHKANHGIRTLPAWAHLISMIYAQVTRCDGLRDLIACLSAQRSKLYHVGVRHRVTRSTLAKAAERRPWQRFEALGQRLISMALALHKDTPIPLSKSGLTWHSKTCCVISSPRRPSSNIDSAAGKFGIEINLLDWVLLS